MKPRQLPQDCVRAVSQSRLLCVAPDAAGRYIMQDRHARGNTEGFLVISMVLPRRNLTGFLLNV